MEAPVTYRGADYPWHCEHPGHMNVMWYVGKCDEATWNFVAMRARARAMLASAAQAS